MVSTSALLVSELDAIDGWPPEKWAGALQQIAKLFLRGADNLAADQIALFDEVLVRLIDRVDAQSLAQLSQQLAAARCTLPLSARRLAFNDDELVSMPILKSAATAPKLVLDVARSGGSKHQIGRAHV